MHRDVGESATVSAVGLTREYGPLRALDEVSFELSEGITGLVGVNGAGKSTLLTTLAGAMRPGQGWVRIGGDDLYRRGERRRAQRRVAFVPQLPVFPKNVTAGEVVTYLAWMRGVSRRLAPTYAQEALEQVGLAARAKTKVGALSGGMLRRVALAQALASRAEVLLLDEPSTGLDPRQRRSMVELLHGLPGTVLISSHVMEDIEELADRLLVLDEGRLRFDGDLAGLAGLAPEGTQEHRRLEAGFLTICMRGNA